MEHLRETSALRNGNLEVKETAQKLAVLADVKGKKEEAKNRKKEAKSQKK